MQKCMVVWEVHTADFFCIRKRHRRMKKSYKLQENEDVLKAYLYCNYHALPEEEYTKMLSGNSRYLGIDAELKEEKERISVPILRLAKKEKKLNTENADIVGLTRNKEYDTITERFSVVK